MKDFLNRWRFIKRTAIVASVLPILIACLYGKKIVSPLPFNQAAVKQSTSPALQGPDASKPYFNVRFAMPVPPDNDMHLNGTLVGIDAAVTDHHHSPGFEVMPNGDVLMVSFSGPGGREYGPNLRIVQARLRYGAEEFDMPEEISLNGVKMQNLLTADGRPALAGPPLLWREGQTVWMFTGWGREDVLGVNFPYSFRVFKSNDNGATWKTVALEPQFSSTNADAQPINSAFRASNGDMFVAVDGKQGAGQSLLWRSSDNGLTWTDQGGRTSGRHSTIVPLNSNGRLLSLGGKDTHINGYMPQNISTDWGKTWEPGTQSPFPRQGANQRPSVIRLANGNLVMVGDARFVHAPNPPSGWSHGDGPYVALSTDNGLNWTIKALPVALKHETRAHSTLGYATVRQAPNGLIHVFATMTHPCLHYEFNEAWIADPSAGDITPESTGGTVQSYSENYPDGSLRTTWSARITPNGRYLLDGIETHFYENGTILRQVTWVNGRRNGIETLWGSDGVKVWSWNHDLANNVSVWTHWWPNGRKRLESQWDTYPAARDLPHRRFRGLVANGTARHWNENGQEIGVYTFLNGDRIAPRGNHKETFVTSPYDRGWTGNNNTSDGNNFGWSSNTSWCENQNAEYMHEKGEIGGVFARSTKYHWYADTCIGKKNRTQTLHLAGNLRMVNENFDGKFRIGYFNTRDPANNFVGIEIREPTGTPITPMVHFSGKLFRAYLTVNGPGGTISSVPLELEMNFLGATFDLTWTGNADGSGTLSGTVTSLPVSITVAAGSGNFNAFGILAGGNNSDDPTKKTGTCYFDNLTYSKDTVTTCTKEKKLNRNTDSNQN
jgi:antitoxin component YwqK of YwqJK toxin-antitoxin module